MIQFNRIRAREHFGSSLAQNNILLNENFYFRKYFVRPSRQHDSFSDAKIAINKVWDEGHLGLIGVGQNQFGLFFQLHFHLNIVLMNEEYLPKSPRKIFEEEELV